MAAYRAFHRAMKYRDGQQGVGAEYKQALEEAVALDPSFTRAWAELVGNFSLSSCSTENPEEIARAEQILEKIRMIAPDSADHLIAQAYYTYYLLKNYDHAYQLITRAQSLAPSDIRLLELKSWIQRRQGNLAGKVESNRAMHELDPRNPRWASTIVSGLVLFHQYDAAQREVEDADLQEYYLETWRSVFQLRDEADWERWFYTSIALQKKYETTSNSQDLWDAYIAVRDFEATELLSMVDVSSSHR